MPLARNAWVVLRKAPPLPFLPADSHGKEVVVVPVFYSGDAGEGEKQVQRLRSIGTPIGEHLGRQPYVEWQQTFDPLLTRGARNYWKSHNFADLSDGAIDVTASATVLNDTVERWVSDDPAQWMWFHKRWKRERRG